MTNLIVYCYILPWIECWLASLQEFQKKITLTLHSSAKIPHIPENLDNKMFTSIVLLKFEIIWDIFFFPGELAEVRGGGGGERGRAGVQLRLPGHCLQPHQVLHSHPALSQCLFK